MKQALLDLLALPDSVVNVVNLDLLVLSAPQDQPDQGVNLDLLGQLDSEENLANVEKMEGLEVLDLVEKEVKLDLQDLQVHLEVLVALEALVLVARPVLVVNLEHVEKQDLQADLDHLAVMVNFLASLDLLLCK